MNTISDMEYAYTHRNLADDYVSDRSDNSQAWLFKKLTARIRNTVLFDDNGKLRMVVYDNEKDLMDNWIVVRYEMQSLEIL